MKCILHIGLPKTGTTAIQSALSTYDDGETFYAQLGHDNHSAAIVTVFNKDYVNYHTWVKLGLSESEIETKRDEFRGKLHEQFGRKARETIIVSGEGIGLLPDDAIVEFIRFIEGYCDDIKVIAYVRHPLDHAASAFQQKVQGGLDTVPEILPSFTRYRLRRFLTLLGKDRMMVKEYSPGSLLHGDVVKDFCSTLQLDMSLAKTKQINMSLGANALKCLYLFNVSNPLHYGDPELYQSRNQLIQILKRIFENDVKSDRSIFSSIADNRESDWLKEEFDIDFTTDTDKTMSHKDLADWLSGISPDVTEDLIKFLKQNGVKEEFDRDPAKIITRIYYMVLQGKTLQSDGLELMSSRLNDEDADILRDIALKYESNKEISRQEALSLMKVAQRARPQGQLIRQKILEWTSTRTEDST